jgi:hypothetical protein
VLEVTDNHHIDAPDGRALAGDHPPAGVDTSQNTIFFVNWYGRPDFKFHVYTKTDEPEPDSGFNFGVEAESRKLIAWGGTTPDDEENGLGFTSSPLYPPYLTPAALPHTVNIDSNTYEGIPGVDASREFIEPQLLLDELSELQRTTRFSYDNQDLPFTGKARQCYELWLQNVKCFPELDYPASDGNLFLYNALNLERTQDDAGRVDYELPNFNYATTDDVSGGLLGFADDNYRTGTQSFVFNFVSPAIAELYGLTTTMIHEDGHHLAMSHIDLNWDFSQFDRVNMNRYMAAAFAGKAAYDQVRKGARQAGVAVVGSTEGWEVDRSSGSAPATGAVADGAADDAARHHRHRMRR